MTICGLYLHHGNTESRKNLEQKLIFQLGTLSPYCNLQSVRFEITITAYFNGYFFTLKKGSTAETSVIIDNFDTLR